MTRPGRRAGWLHRGSRLQFATMQLRSVALLALLAACEAPPTPAPAEAAASPFEAPDQTWNEHMEDVDAHCSELTRLLLREPLGDLKRAATVAQEAAARVRLGYGKFEDPRVPDYARMARDCESWLRQIALEARQAHGDLAAELYRTGRRQHCNDCHDAHEKVYR